jgi:hypothetical protein
VNGLENRKRGKKKAAKKKEEQEKDEGRARKRKRGRMKKRFFLKIQFLPRYSWRQKYFNMKFFYKNKK